MKNFFASFDRHGSPLWGAVFAGLLVVLLACGVAAIVHSLKVESGCIASGGKMIGALAKDMRCSK
jgi:hypothetical protein